MDKLWIVLLFLGVFLLLSNLVKRFAIRFLNSAENKSAVSVIAAEKDDPKVFWAEEGFRREPQQAEFDLPEDDFFENEKTEFCESFEDELKNLSEEEICEVLEKSGLSEKEGDF
ncbi:MAG: hypothetical protein IJO22_05735 [Oscillospiraceae bacterium]|nr:hypothetical protein [Oscillospiraceae bacterium]